MLKNMFKLVKILLFSVFSSWIFIFPISDIRAEENTGEQPELAEKDEAVEDSGIFSTLYLEKYGSLNQDDTHYLLDIVSMNKEQMESEENKSWWQKGWGMVNGSAIEDSVMGQIYELINMVNNYAFQFNIGLSQFMLSTLNLAYEFDLIDELINKLQALVQDITGISGVAFGNSGLFGSFAGVIAVLAVAYACYLYVWKRAATESIGEMMKTVLTFAIALLFFSNYSAFLSGINQVTTEASQLVLSGSVNKASLEESDNMVSGTGEVTLREKMMDNIWTLFVDRPYLFMQYGTDNIEDIGSERIQELIKQPAGQDREDYVIEKEVKGVGNNMMTYGSVMERAVFTPLYLFVNGLSSIPVFLLALLLLVFQFWFMGIAAVAPFALLFAAIPGQFGVLKKYFVELGLPLVLKIVVSFGAIVVFAISEVVYNLNNIAVQGASEYIMICVLQFILLALMFFLRNRIKNIFSAGSKEFQALRAEVGSLQEAVTRPVKTGVQSTATVAGAVAGGVMTGGAGIAAGANIGSKVGQIATGEGSIQSVTSSISQAQLLTRLQEKHVEKGQAGETERYLADPDQPIHESPIGEQASPAGKTNHYQDSTPSMEQPIHQDGPAAEAMEYTNWSEPEKNKGIRMPSNQKPEESATDTHSDDKYDFYANLASLQHHIPPTQNENNEEVDSYFSGQKKEGPVEDTKDTNFHVTDIGYISAEETAGRPALHPFEKEENEKAHVEEEKWNDDLRSNHNDYNDTAQNKHEEKLHNLKTDKKDD